MPDQEQSSTYYDLLGLPPSASPQQIRQVYRELSKLYHPDTTALPAQTATEKFQALNEAYATLSNPERRLKYDFKIGYSRVAVVRPLEPLTAAPSPRRSSAYLDPTDRPLSAGELFALFILGLTFVVCLVLVVTVGITRGEAAFQSFNPFDRPVVAAPSVLPKSLNAKSSNQVEQILIDQFPDLTSPSSESIPNPAATDWPDLNPSPEKDTTPAPSPAASPLQSG